MCPLPAVGSAQLAPARARAVGVVRPTPEGRKAISSAASPLALAWLASIYPDRAICKAPPPVRAAQGREASPFSASKEQATEHRFPVHAPPRTIARG